MTDVGITLPLRHPVYRRIWSASLLSNFGQLIQGVGAAWAMTQLTGSTAMVALVQTASMLPLMLWSIPAGAIADMYDKRKVALAGLSLSLSSAAILCALSVSGAANPTILLLFCFLIGSGMALYSPAWQASVAEQVPSSALPQAIALNSISYNIARSFGPAVGGVIVALAGASAAFASNALFYLPLIIVLLLWQRIQPPTRLPPERVGRAIVSGIRYVMHSPSIRDVLVRTVLMGVLGGSISALMPLIARTLLGGGALVYGIILGAFGVGAVLGALVVAVVRRRYSGEAAIRSCAIGLGLAMIGIGFSRLIFFTVPLLLFAGALWMLSIALFNIGVQTSAPRWVAGRALAAFQASVTGGVALGSWMWGSVAQDHGISVGLYASGALMILSPLAGLRFRIPEPSDPLDTALVTLAEPEVSLALTLRSGPIVVELEYCIAPEQAREFYQLIQKVQLFRQRNGAYGWSISRDIANASLWTERFHCPTWLDYLHQRSRSTQSERNLHETISSLHRGPSPIRVRRMLERPFGSVRWQDDAPDTGVTGVLPLS